MISGVWVVCLGTGFTFFVVTKKTSDSSSSVSSFVSSVLSISTGCLLTSQIFSSFWELVSVYCLIYPDHQSWSLLEGEGSCEGCAVSIHRPGLNYSDALESTDYLPISTDCIRTISSIHRQPHEPYIESVSFNSETLHPLMSIRCQEIQEIDIEKAQHQDLITRDWKYFVEQERFP